MSFLSNKNIAILGGTGTLGKAIVKELALNHKPRKVLIYSRDEIKQLEMIEEFDDPKYSFLEFKLGDVRDFDRLEEVLKGCEYVIHAAAIKHVVMAENNPDECHKTNVLGTKNVIDACLNQYVNRAILISTDKAINPIGVYGQSKREAELYWNKANHAKKCEFNIVRMGNIEGSRGSVFEAFERQRKTGVLKVTHPEATRFVISKEDAAKFVISSLSENNIQDVFIPKMRSFKVIDLAKKMAPECRIEIIGLRPGDKLHEELEGQHSSELPKLL